MFPWGRKVSEEKAFVDDVGKECEGFAVKDF